MFDLQQNSTTLLVAAAAVLVGLVLLVAIFRVLRRRRRPPGAAEHDLRIDLSALGDHGPPEGAARLEFYNIPVRLAVVVLAPLGRGELPSTEQLPNLVDSLLPHMMRVLGSHRPAFRRWPAQLSWQGFSHVFFRNVALPGDHGKGSPWCAIAGKFSANGQNYLAGLVCCAADSNSLGQVVVEHEGQWLDVLRIYEGRGG